MSLGLVVRSVHRSVGQGLGDGELACVRHGGNECKEVQEKVGCRWRDLAWAAWAGSVLEWWLEGTSF